MVFSMAYTESIAKKIEEYLKAQDWSFVFDSVGGMFSVEADLTCKFGAALVVYQVTEGGFLCYTTVAGNAPADMRAVVGEYLHRANYGLPNGNFEFDYDDGSVHFKTYFDCPDGEPTQKQLSDSMAIGLTVLDHYGDGLYTLISSSSLARQLIVKADE